VTFFATATATALHDFGLARRPPAGPARITRWAAPVLTGALLLGASGRRGAATAAISATSVAAVAQQLVALKRNPLTNAAGPEKGRTTRVEPAATG
jgi:hypothetical protein